MQLKLIVHLASLVTWCHASTLPRSRTGTIQWHQCQQNGTLPVVCGTLSVPLDYTDLASNRTINLSLVKVNATTKPFKGSILFNPGGPGEDGTSFINGALAEPLLVATGGHHDLIGFDPRGTGNTLPFSCYKSEVLRLLAGILLPSTTNASDTALGTTWAIKQTLAENCLATAHQTGELIGTAFVARDMMKIVDALDEDGMLRYWGYSYGTLLGETVAAMFPERMDKVVLDGVLNPTQYYEGRDVQQLLDSDATFAGFFSGCIAAPNGSCALAHPGATADGLEQQIINLLDDLKYNPLAAGPSQDTSIVSYGTVKNAITTALYTVSLWPSLAESLNDLLHGNATTLLTFVAENESAPYPNFLEINAGIRCGDNSLRAERLDQVTPLVDAMYQTSFVFGDDQASVPLTCANWRLQAKERYGGGFSNIKTKNPLLLIGNTYDPLTPLASAKNASAGFIGSVVLQNDGHGHTSLGQASLCTAKAVRAYFVNGTLPEKGTKCEPTVKLFSNETIEQAWAPLANISSRAVDMETDDAMLAALVQMSKGIGRHR